MDIKLNDKTKIFELLNEPNKVFTYDVSNYCGTAKERLLARIFGESLKESCNCFYDTKRKRVLFKRDFFNKNKDEIKKIFKKKALLKEGILKISEDEYDEKWIKKIVSYGIVTIIFDEGVNVSEELLNYLYDNGVDAYKFDEIKRIYRLYPNILVYKEKWQRYDELYDDFTSNTVLISFQEVEYPMDLNEVISIINNALSDDRIANKTIIIDMRFLKLIDLEKLCINSNSSNILFLKNGNLYKYDFVFKELNKMKLMVNDISKSDLSPLEMVTAVYDIVKNYKKYTFFVENHNNRFTESEKELNIPEKEILDTVLSSKYKKYVKGKEFGLSYTRDPLKVLNNSFIVCSGYVNIMIELLGVLGINARYLSISFDSEAETIGDNFSHALCLIDINDKKYNIKGKYISDPTYDSIESYDVTEKENDKYSNLLSNIGIFNNVLYNRYNNTDGKLIDMAIDDESSIINFDILSKAIIEVKKFIYNLNDKEKKEELKKILNKNLDDYNKRYSEELKTNQHYIDTMLEKFIEFNHYM